MCSDLRLVVDHDRRFDRQTPRIGSRSRVAIVAEGIAERLNREQLEHFDSRLAHAYGHVRLADVPLGAVLRDAWRKRLEEIGVDMTVVNKDIGYELRCAETGAVRRRIHPHARLRRRALPLTRRQRRADRAHRWPRDAGDARRSARSANRRVRVRMVDVTTEAYEVARSYMIRLDPATSSIPRLSQSTREPDLSPGRLQRRVHRVGKR